MGRKSGMERRVTVAVYCIGQKRLFNVLVNHLGDGAEDTLSKPADYTKLEGAADTPESCAATQHKLNKLEKWASRNLTKSKRGKHKVLHLGRNNHLQQCLLDNN